MLLSIRRALSPAPLGPARRSSAAPADGRGSLTAYGTAYREALASAEAARRLVALIEQVRGTGLGGS